MATPSLADLYKTKDITEDQLEEAVAAYFTAPADQAFQLGSGFGLNLADVVHANPFAFRVVRDTEASMAAKRNAVKTAILLAVPTKLS